MSGLTWEELERVLCTVLAKNISSFVNSVLTHIRVSQDPMALSKWLYKGYYTRQVLILNCSYLLTLFHITCHFNFSIYNPFVCI
jgi:hypothetical protein